MPRRRKSIWVRFNSGSIALGAANNAVNLDLLGNYKTAFGTPPVGATVGRIRFDINVSLTTAADPVFIGVRVADFNDQVQLDTDAEEVATGPVANPSSDWLYWRCLFPNHGADAVTGVANTATYELDMRAMRRLDEPGMSVFCCLAKSLATTPTVAFAASTLLLLP